MTQVVKVEPPDHHLGDSSLATGPCFFSVLYTIPISSALVLCFLFQASLPSSEFIYLAALGLQFSLVQFSHSVLSNSLRPLWVAAPGLPVHHQLPEFTQTHVHRVGEAIQPSHPVSSPSPPAPNPSQHQSLFQWVKSWYHYPGLHLVKWGEKSLVFIFKRVSVVLILFSSLNV